MERIANNNTMRRSTARYLATIGLLGACAGILMSWEIPVPFAPPFYKLDFSEVPALLGTFTMGPLAGVYIEVVKTLIKLLIKGTDTAFLGEAVGLMGNIIFVVPAGLVYKKFRNNKGILVALVVGIAIRLAWASFANAYISLPMYARIYGWPLEQLIGMGTAVNPNITDLRTFTLFAVLPFNALKSTLVGIATYLLCVSGKLVDRLRMPR